MESYDTVSQAVTVIRSRIAIVVRVSFFCYQDLLGAHEEVMARDESEVRTERSWLEKVRTERSWLEKHTIDALGEVVHCSRYTLGALESVLELSEWN